MSDARSNLLTRGMRGDAKTISGISFAWDGDWYHVSGTATGGTGWRAYKSTDIPIVADKKYTLSVEFADGMPGADTYYSSSFQLFSDFSKNTYKTVLGMNRNEHVAFSVDQSTLDAYHVGFQIWGPIIKGGATVDLRVRWMLVEGDTPAAWAPAEGETLVGGGAQMSANLLDGVTPTPMSGTTEDGGVWHCPAKDGKYDRIAWSFSGMSALTANQTYHLGLSVKGASANASDLHMVIAYKDAAGNRNWAWSDAMPVGTEWSRSEATVVVPSGMTMTALTVSTNSSAKLPEVWLTSPTLSLGSPVPLATSAHTPYATQDHLAAEYATKAALKVTSDAVTAEVEERGKLAGKVGTLESTSGTHTSKLEQLATSIKSLVKGESTYTDPDGKSATSGIYSLVTQTRDSVTALFGQYTKTADLASTQAVKDAKKAGTDAQAAASAAQTTADSAKSTAQAAASDAATAKTNAASAVSTANSASTSAANAVETANAASSTASSASSTANSAASTANAAKTSAASAVSTANSANSTANTAKSTADSLATMIREDATGITVGKSADGKTYSTGRTRMTADAFEVLSNAGEVLSSFGKDKVRLGVDGAQIDMAGGRLLIDAQDHAASEMPSGLPTTITRMICPSSNSGKNDTEMYLGAYDKDSGNVVGGMGITVTRETDGSYNTSVGISGSLSLGSATLATPLPVSSGGTGATSIDAARRNLHISQGSKVCHGHGTPWVTLFESWDEFRQETGCYGSDTPTLVTMNGDWSAFDGTLSGCEVRGGYPVYVLAQTTGGLPNISSSQSLRINWICIW